MVLDKYCPMNKNKPIFIKKYRKIREKGVIVSKNRVLFRLGQVRKAKKALAKDPNNTLLKVNLESKINILKWET